MDDLYKLCRDEQVYRYRTPDWFSLGAGRSAQLEVEAAAYGLKGEMETVWGVPVRACGVAAADEFGFSMGDACPFCGKPVSGHDKLHVRSHTA